MKKEDPANETLIGLPQIVVTATMKRLVPQDELKLQWSQVSEAVFGQEDHRRRDPNEGGGSDGAADPDLDVLEPESFLHPDPDLWNFRSSGEPARFFFESPNDEESKDEADPGEACSENRKPRE